MSNKRVKIGISTFNDHEYLGMLLQSIRWYTNLAEEFDVVVCDDGSHPSYLPKIEEECTRFGATLLKHERNLGIPAAWNHLARSLGGEAEIVVLLNNDIIVPPQWLDVAVYFLDANRDNPNVGSCFWNPINRVSKEMMRALLPDLGHTTMTTRDLISGREPDFWASDHFEHRVGHGHGLGRVMCPCGCCFAFHMDVFNEVGGFWEELISFHEESAFGTLCAEKGRASYGFAYPRPYHTHGAAFAANPSELRPGPRMVESRRMYRERFGVPGDVPDNAYFQWVNERLMPAIPTTRLKYLSPDYDAEPVTVKLSGGEEVRLPRLVEREGDF